MKFDKNRAKSQFIAIKPAFYGITKIIELINWTETRLTAAIETFSTRSLPLKYHAV
jgi:hypothetical protein